MHVNLFCHILKVQYTVPEVHCMFTYYAALVHVVPGCLEHAVTVTMVPMATLIRLVLIQASHKVGNTSCSQTKRHSFFKHRKASPTPHRDTTMLPLGCTRSVGTVVSMSTMTGYKSLHTRRLNAFLCRKDNQNVHEGYTTISMLLCVR